MRTVDYRALNEEERKRESEVLETCTICGKIGIFLQGFGENEGHAGFAHVVELNDENKTGHVLVGCRFMGRGGKA